MCKGFELPAGMSSNSLMAQWNPSNPGQWTPEEKILIPFLICGDLSGCDIV